jgi:hypothetical protein
VQKVFEKKEKIKGKEKGSSVFSLSGFKFCKAAIYKQQCEQ